MRLRRVFTAENMNIQCHLLLNLLKSEKTYKSITNLNLKKSLLSHDYLLKAFFRAQAISPTN